jgi:lipoprotein-anchoring transpeptidase ErfK/SrfK
MRFLTTTLTAGLLAGLATAPVGAQSAPRDTGLILSSVEQAVNAPLPEVESLSLLVDLSARTLFVMDGRRVVRRYPVAVGGDEFPTPRGEFGVRRMIWNPSWRPPPSGWARDHHYEPPGSPGNPMGRVKIFFQEPDFYIHGTGLASSLGRPASHGCIRMRNTDAAEVARMIMANGGARRDADWFRETLGNPTTSREVTLARRVPLVVRA